MNPKGLFFKVLARISVIIAIFHGIWVVKRTVPLTPVCQQNCPLDTLHANRPLDTSHLATPIWRNIYRFCARRTDTTTVLEIVFDGNASFGSYFCYHFF